MTHRFRVLVFSYGKISSWKFSDLKKAHDYVDTLPPGTHYDIVIIVESGTSPYTSTK